QTWFRPDNTITSGTSQMDVFNGNSPASNDPRMRFTTSGTVNVFLEVTSDNNEGCYGVKNSWAAGSWFQFTYVRSMSLVRAYQYVNATLDVVDNSADNANPHLPWNQFSLLASIDGSRVWGSGAISEFRILNVAVSSDWISTEYNNQYNPNSFYSISDIQMVYIPSIFDFQYFKEITIDHTKVSGTNNLINFPILISSYDSDLHDKVQADGDDIAFNNGTSWLFHEIELFNQNYNSTHAQLIAWVCIPILSSSVDTIIRMYYGNSTMGAQDNPQGVWDSNYIAVYHLNDNPTGLINDSIKKINLIGNNMDISDLINGQIGYGFNFDSSGIEYLTSAKVTTIQAFTFSLWANPELHPNWEVLMNFDTEGSNFRYFAISDIDTIGYDGEGGLSYFGSGVSQNSWQFFVLTYDGSQMKAYRNGNQLGSSVSKTIQKRTDDFEIGSYHKGVELYDGQMDEVRISYIARSNDWIITEYNNQYNPKLFYSLSNEIKVEDDNPKDDIYFRYYKIIKIDNKMVFGTGDFVNFPVLISLFDSDLRFDVQSDGDDIAFSLGSKWLDHEIELFDKTYNGTHAELVAWIRIPELSTCLDTYIRMYYGNATMSSRENPDGLWDTSYRGVWHLAESSGFTQDSTAYSENGLVTGTVIRPSTGQIGNAYNYGTDGTFNVGDPTDEHLDFGTESFMVSMWINIDTSTGTWQIPLYKGSSSTWDPGYCFATPITGDSIRFHITDGISNIPSPSANIDFDSWAYIVGIVDRTNGLIRIYKDGYEIGSGVDISTILSIDGDLSFQCAHPNYDFDGLLDEVRVLNQTRSKDWIKTEYYNQYKPNAFFSIGQEKGSAGILYSNLQVNAV
ncbi:MAG: LamG-like jellyroll fold domain-containing protein, partial [Candidatus Thorarchaeota archaeon]